jgi:hypothetical protein
VAKQYIVRLGVGSLVVIALGACLPAVSQTESPPSQSTMRYLDTTSDGKDWPGYGRTFGELHYSPLSEINQDSVRKLGLAWFLNLEQENLATQLIAVDGILYFATRVDAKAELPARRSATLATVDDPNLRSDLRSAEAGQSIYNRRCVSCHGISVVSGTHAPDLRRSSVPLSREAFAAVVRDGAIVAEGMPRFEELTAKDCDHLRQYIRTEAKRQSPTAQ